MTPSNDLQHHHHITSKILQEIIIIYNCPNILAVSVDFHLSTNYNDLFPSFINGKNKPTYSQNRESKNNTMEKLFICNEALDHSKKDLMKTSFNLCFESSSSLKILGLCSDHRHQNKDRRAKCQTVLFLSNPLNFLSKRIFLIEVGNNNSGRRLLRDTQSTRLLTVNQNMINQLSPYF